MSLVDRAVITNFHEMRIQEHGEGTVKALGYRDSRSQLVRFAMLAGIGNMNNCSVLDVGCGYGDLRAYLGEKYTLLHYSGIEYIEAFLAIAAARYAHLPQTAFFLGDCYTAVLPQTNYVLACGSLNYHSTEPGFIYKMITKLFNACNIALGFNLLSKVGAPGGILVAYNVDDIMQHCQTLTANVVLHNNYLDGDFTIWMYK